MGVETLLTIREAADRLKLHPTTLLRAIDAGRLEAVQMGRIYRVSEEALQRYVEKLTVNKMGQRDDASDNSAKN